MSARFAFLVLAALTFAAFPTEAPAQTDCSSVAILKASVEIAGRIEEVEQTTDVTGQGSAGHILAENARQAACERAAVDATRAYRRQFSEGQMHEQVCTVIWQRYATVLRAGTPARVKRLWVEGYAARENKRHRTENLSWDLSCHPSENAIEPQWMVTRRPSEGAIWARVAGGVAGLVVAGQRTGPAFEESGFFGSTSGDKPQFDGEQFTVVNGYKYWDIDTALSSDGSHQFAVAVRMTIGRRAFIDIRRRQRASEGGFGPWSEVRRIEAPVAALLSVAFVSPDRFFVGGTAMLGPQGQMIDSAGYILSYDVTGREVQPPQRIEGTYVMISDLIARESSLHVIGYADSLYDEASGTSSSDLGGFVRAYRLAAPRDSSNILNVDWTSRFHIGDQDPASFGDADPLVRGTLGANGHLFLTGYSVRDLPNVSLHEPEHFEFSSNQPSAWVIKMDSRDGRVVWTKKIGTRQSDAALAIAADTDCGQVWVAGWTANQLISGASTDAFRSSRHSPTNGPAAGAFIVALNPDGTTRWTDSNFLAGRLSDHDGRMAALSGLLYDQETRRLFAAGYLADQYGPVAPGSGKAAFVLSFSDTFGNVRCEAGLAAAPPAPPTPSWAGRCPIPPDTTVWIRQCDGRSFPHEGFPGSTTCSNGWDDDGDGLCDGEDPDCSTTEHELRFTVGCCRRPPDFPFVQEVWAPNSNVCTNGWDDDDNGRCDAMEPACSAPESLSTDPGSLLRDLITPNLPPDALAPLPQGQTAKAQICVDNVQGRIPRETKGTTQWDDAALNQLCLGAEDSPEPGRCYERIMRGEINWGGGNIWVPQNALNLCAGTRNAQATLGCFSDRIGAKQGWRDAIAACNSGAPQAAIRPGPPLAAQQNDLIIPSPPAQTIAPGSLTAVQPNDLVVTSPPAQNICFDTVQGRIPRETKGSTQWDEPSLKQLCQGAEHSAEPGRCYERIMRGEINWGGGNIWNPINALALCAGTRSAQATLGCFTGQIQAGQIWQNAIPACRPR